MENINNVQNLTKPTQVVKNIELETDEVILKKPYKCCMCGTRYTRQKNNFSYSYSPFFKANNSYLPICNNCINLTAEQYETILGSQNEAIRRMCLHWDIYLDEEVIASSKHTSKRSKIKDYMRIMNMPQNSEKTYDDYISENKGLVLSESDLEEMEESDLKKLQKNIARWGAGYTPEEYLMLNNHYKLYKDSIDEDNATQVSLLNDLCEQHVLKSRLLRDKDFDKYEKISRLYQTTLTSANLKPKNLGDQTTNPDECWGNFNKIVETMSPSEYFKDKSIFKDHDEMHDYYTRFIGRPTNNLINGTTIMDEEYVIKVDEDD